VEAVRFTSGEEFGADLVVIATDLRPNTMLAHSAGLQGKPRNRGERSTGDIRSTYFRRRKLHTAQVPLLEQAKVLAANLAGAFQELTISPLHHRAE